jgi:hypothetical protein
MVTAVKRPQGEPGEKWLQDLTPDKCHRASPRPYSLLSSPGGFVRSARMNRT